MQVYLPLPPHQSWSGVSEMGSSISNVTLLVSGGEEEV